MRNDSVTNVAWQMGDVTRFGAIVTIGLLGLFLVLARETAAQVADRSWPEFEAGISGALFVDYPSRDAEPWCERRSRGVVGHGAWWPARWIGVRGALVLTGVVENEGGCVLPGPPSRAPIPVDEPFSRNRYVDGAFSGTMFAPDLGIVIEPLRGADVSPRGRLGVGWMAAQGVGYRYLGGGIRFGFGGHALTVDTEWWRFGVDVRTETVIVRERGALEILDSAVFGSGLSMVLVRLGWAVDLH